MRMLKRLEEDFPQLVSSAWCPSPVCLYVWQLFFSLQCISCPMSLSLIAPMWPVSANMDVKHCYILKQQYRQLSRSCNLPTALLQTQSAQLKYESTLCCLPTLTKASLSFHQFCYPVQDHLLQGWYLMWANFKYFFSFCFSLFSFSYVQRGCAAGASVSTAELQLVPTPPAAQCGPTVLNFTLLLIYIIVIVSCSSLGSMWQMVTCWRLAEIKTKNKTTKNHKMVVWSGSISRRH